MHVVAAFKIFLFILKEYLLWQVGFKRWYTFMLIKNFMYSYISYICTLICNTYVEEICKIVKLDHVKAQPPDAKCNSYTMAASKST